MEFIITGLIIVTILIIGGVFYFSGTWEEEFRGKGTATSGLAFTNKYDREVSIIVIIERNTKTGKRRAYAKEMDGTTHSMDVDWVLAHLLPKGVEL